LSLFLDNWRVLLPGAWAPIALALMSVLCGAIVGLERERREKPAGLRTLVLVSLGAAVFTLVGFVFTSETGDPGRVAAQIVTGIGFLGAGVILHSSGGVSGMTTAATIWVTAAIGMTVGAGYAGAGLGLSLLVRGVLTLLHVWESRYMGGQGASVDLVFDPAGGKTRIRIARILDGFDLAHLPLEWTPLPDGTERLQLTFRLARRHRRDFLLQLAALPEVREIREETPG